MSSIAAIRTNRWGEEEVRLLARLAPVFGDDLAVVFHDRPAGVMPPAGVVDIGDEWAEANGFALVPDWGWRCGDYAYYALRAARPGYDFYWLIEPDVHFTSDAGAFFERFRHASDDVLGHALAPFDRDIRFTRGLPGMAHFRAIFALTRFSGRALDRLAGIRRGLNRAPVSMRDYPNDEVFAFSCAMADPALTCGRLDDRAPDWFEQTQFAPDPDLLYDAVAGAARPGKVMHPVRGRDGFKRALGTRLAANTGILMRMREAIDLLDDGDIDDIAAVAADHVRQSLSRLQRQRQMRRHRGASR